MPRSRTAIAFVIVIALVLWTLFSSKKLDVSVGAGAYASGRTSAFSDYKPEQSQQVSESRQPHKNSSKTKSSDNSHDRAPLEHKVFCQLKRADVGIPIEGHLKIVSFQYGADEDEDSGIIAYVSSSECPDGGFSKLRLDRQGRVESVLNCQTTSKSEIAIQSGIQSNILDKPSTGADRNFAISGGGFFVTSCPHGIVLQRSGNFRFLEGKLWHGFCEVLNQFGEPISEDPVALDRQGCGESGSCLALASIPDTHGTPIDRTSILIEDSNLEPLSDSRIFSGSLEDFSDPNSGPLGPEWESVPHFHPPQTCPQL